MNFSRVAPAAAAEDQNIDQRIGPQAVGAVHGDAGDFARRVKSRQRRVLLVDHHAALNVGGNPAHRVVRGGLDGNRLRERLDAQIGPDKFGNVRELFIQDLFSQVGHVEVNVILAVDAPPFANLPVNRARNHVARGEVKQRGRIALHKALVLIVAQNGALTARRFAQQDAHLVNAGGMELEKFHILQRNPAAIDHRHAVAGQRVGVGADAKHLAAATRGEQDHLGMKGVNFPRGQAQRHHSRAAPLLNQQVEDVILVVKVHIVLDALLVAGLKNHVPGAVRGVAGAPHGRFAEFPVCPPKGRCAIFPSAVRLKGRPQCSRS